MKGIAHLKHGINRVVIFDIDLHHGQNKNLLYLLPTDVSVTGNGTQSIIWQINEETYRVKLEESYDTSPGKPGLQVFYGSIHDILSYPCEVRKKFLKHVCAEFSLVGWQIKFSSGCLSVDTRPTWTVCRKHSSRAVHDRRRVLHRFVRDEVFTTPSESPRLHRGYGRRERRHASVHKVHTDSRPYLCPKADNVRSCGFDASEHEYESMSRHQRKVPVSFYHRFAQDAKQFARTVAKGRLISVLEGGYSDRALTSGVIAHLSGLADESVIKAGSDWWSVENLVAVGVTALLSGSI